MNFSVSMRYTLIRMAEKEMSDTTKYRHGCRATEIFMHLGKLIAPSKPNVCTSMASNSTPRFIPNRSLFKEAPEET